MKNYKPTFRIKWCIYNVIRIDQTLTTCGERLYKTLGTRACTQIMYKKKIREITYFLINMKKNSTEQKYCHHAYAVRKCSWSSKLFVKWQSIRTMEWNSKFSTENRHLQIGKTIKQGNDSLVKSLDKFKKALLKNLS